eukprot:gnl/Spiro4/9010_TR4753_c0_g1_i1.p1 gnl/Spiro4/9010_TR4753_c0_g1~~gnl/Spiro4/9010_TR4753_c0_g1_i1.p1  ORF type:complete len:657 (+),score=218.65 gnl/Spiro4/9010_TR4753_c0_g1_i1:77-2047(+)
MVVYNFKKIRAVPTSKDFCDIVLSKTQRKTPTVIHKHYAISRIRSFYMRKVRFTQAEFHDRLSAILEDFPRIEDIHPFYADLMNVLYDRDHYKLALGKMAFARQLVDNLGKEYVKLLKFGDSLYRCKQLKRAALGRMCTLMRKQGSELAYLNEVRQHLSRLPSIDPTARTLLICGFPNVGKSSFMNKLTRANSEVQPFAFTTRQLLVGHTDYQFLRWQVVDTPGILDHPLDDRNTIEMQSITALAHLQAAIIYIIDISETCGFTIAEQVSLFNSIKPLFHNKPLFIVMNKIDVVRPEMLSDEYKALLQTLALDGVTFATMSAMTEEGVSNVKNMACEAQLKMRVHEREAHGKLQKVANRLTVTQPIVMPGVERPATIPAQLGAMPEEGAEPRVLERDLERALGGPGVYSADMRKYWDLANPDWRHDVIPEIMDGHNIADFIDPDILERLEELEREEEERERLAEEAGAVYDPDNDALEAEEQELIDAIRSRKKLIQQERKLKRSSKPQLSSLMLEKAAKKKSKAKAHQATVEARGGLIEMASEDNPGSNIYDDPNHPRSVVSLPRKRKSSQIARAAVEQSSLSRKSHVSPAIMNRTPQQEGFRDLAQKTEAIKKQYSSQKQRNRDAKKGEGDHHVPNWKPKHLFSGKRGIGKTDWR